MSQINTNAILDASGGTTTSINGYTPTASNMAGRNRIINGDMRIDQRNAGASITGNSNEFSCDRWKCVASVASKFTVQQSTTAPAGFTNSLLITSSSAYTVGASESFGVRQILEGYNVSDLNWGTSNAQTVTLSFWVRSSLTGTFGGAVFISANNVVFTYTINSANTWEYKTVTIAGPTSTSYTASTTNGDAGSIFWSIGAGATLSTSLGTWVYGTAYRSATGATSVVGTSGATLYITGVQLEAGSVATPFEHRQYGQELALCQRYFYQIGGAVGVPISVGFNRAASRMDTFAFFPVRMRATPTGSVVSGTNYYYVDYSQATTFMNSFSIDSLSNQGARLINTGLSGLTAGSGAVLAADKAAALVSFSSEL